MKIDIETALDTNVVPWTNIEFRSREFWIFSEPTSTSTNQLVFLPTMKNSACLYACYQAAYKWGYNGVTTDNWQGFSIIQQVGTTSGQLVQYPHIKMIPSYTLEDGV